MVSRRQQVAAQIAATGLLVGVLVGLVLNHRSSPSPNDLLQEVRSLSDGTRATMTHARSLHAHCFEVPVLQHNGSIHWNEKCCDYKTRRARTTGRARPFSTWHSPPVRRSSQTFSPRPSSSPKTRLTQQSATMRPRTTLLVSFTLPAHHALQAPQMLTAPSTGRRTTCQGPLRRVF